MSERLCLVCKHFYFDGGQPRWSDLTPGTDASFGCQKGHRFRGQEDSAPTAEDVGSEHGLRLLNSTAEDCADFDPNREDATP